VHRAVMWSPAFQWGYDRAGALEDTFHKFADQVECSSKALDCLRKASTDDLTKANQKITSEALKLGMFPFGPAVDGDLVPELPAALLSKGKHTSCSSIIVSHDHDEVSLFLAKWVDTEEEFSEFLTYAFPGVALANIRDRIEKQYPAKFFDSQQKMRMRKVLRDSTFVCNTRQIYNAFHNDSTVYTAKFELPPAQHGFDMFALIWHRGVAVSELLKNASEKIPDFILDLFDNIWPGFAPKFQAYFAGHAVAGDPNLFSSHRRLDWEPTVDDGNELTNSLKMGLYPNYVHPFFKVGRDAQNSMDNCAFWDEIAKDISALKKESASLVSFREQLELR
jgi:carboxylesterase type B